MVTSLDEHNKYVERVRRSANKLDLAWCLARALAAYDAEREARVKAEKWALYWRVRGSQELIDYAELMCARAEKIEEYPTLGDKEPPDDN